MVFVGRGVCEGMVIEVLTVVCGLAFLIGSTFSFVLFCFV